MKNLIRKLKRKKVTHSVKILNPKYTGLMGSSYESGISLGVQTTTTKEGYLFLTKSSSETKDVWLVMGKGEGHHDWTVCSVDYFWGIVKIFDHDQKQQALQYLMDLKGE